MHMRQEQIFVGIDGGGTKCRARLFSSNDVVLGTGLGGPANPYHGQEQAQASIVHAVEMAMKDAGLNSGIEELIAGVGLAGVNLPSVFQAMNSWQHPFKKMYLTTDLHIACLGAHLSDEGAVLVVGTGSCGYSYVNGKALMIGGHGFTCGDQGSGAWMGLAAVRAVLLANDGLGPKTNLSNLIERHLGVSGEIIVDKLGAAKSSDFAELAQFVFEAAEHGDEIATSILREGADYLSGVADKLWQSNPGRMSLIGGLSGRITPWLKPSVTANLSNPISQPEFGAVYFAKQGYTFDSLK